MITPAIHVVRRETAFHRGHWTALRTTKTLRGIDDLPRASARLDARRSLQVHTYNSPAPLKLSAFVTISPRSTCSSHSAQT